MCVTRKCASRISVDTCVSVVSYVSVIDMSCVWYVSAGNELCESCVTYMCRYTCGRRLICEYQWYVMCVIRQYASHISVDTRVSVVSYVSVSDMSCVWYVNVRHKHVIYMNESCHKWMSHVICEWVMSYGIVHHICVTYLNESCHGWKIHVTCIWFMSIHVTTGWIMSHVTASCHVYQSCHTYMSHINHVTCIWLIHVWVGHVTCIWVMSHMDKSCPMWLSYVQYEGIARTCTHSYIHTHRCLELHTPTYLHTYTHTYLHTYIHTYIHTCIHINIHTYIHTYILTYTHAYIHTYIHTGVLN